jgi:aryl-alcohol dehydrogenase-like predicted oxidoreductase
MKYRRLGRSGLTLSAVGLGTGSATFVGRADEPTAIEIIHTALDLGITYFDTAETYAEGRAERLLGQALKSCRDDVVIATKFGKDRSVGPTEQRGSRSRVIKAAEGSLRRLDTDYIDLYVMHEPDPDTPIDETLSALDDLCRAGKVRYIGCSDFQPWQVADAVWSARHHRWPGFIAAGAPYNLLDRRIERSLVPCCTNYGVSVVPTFPLGASFLTGKYRTDAPPPAGSRFATVPDHAAALRQDLGRHRTWFTDANFARMADLADFARERRRRPTELAIAWLLAHDWLGAVPVGVSRAEQLVENVRGAEWELDASELDAIESIIAPTGV